MKALQTGNSFVGDVSDEELADALARGYVATDDPADLAGFDVAVISVPTPLRDGMPDLSYIEQAGATLGAHLRPGACVILESTTYPGHDDRAARPDPRGGLRASAPASTGSATPPSGSTRATSPTRSSTRRR